MGDKIIIHLSDLHFSTHIDDDGNKISDIKSYLHTDESVDITRKYITHFIEYIQGHYQGDELFLIVSGDLADRAEKNEYNRLQGMLEQFVEELGIDKSNMLIIPGDHDVNRASLSFAYTSSDKLGNAYDLHEAKFKFFSDFYVSFFGREFLHSNIISDRLVFDQEKLIILGLNSNGRIGTKGGDGFIDTDKLKKELKELSDYKGYSKIAVVHHNMTSHYEDSTSGQWDKANKVEVLNLLQAQSINVVLYGNEHTASSNKSNELSYISAASFAKKDSRNGFRCYKINSGEKDALFFDNIKISIQNEGANTSYEFGTWSSVELNKQTEHLSKIHIRRPVAKETLDAFELTGSRESAQDLVLGLPESPLKKKEILKAALVDGELAPIVPKPEPGNFHSKIFQIVKENGLFKSGHFHWNDSSKAHNWIDVPSLLADRENLFTAQKAILDVVHSKGLEYDLVIGLGMEGNILASYTAIKSDKPYSFLPYSYRYNDHEDYEKQINLENDGTFAKILIVTDIVKNGTTLNKLLEHEKDFFAEKYVSSISVVCLFYTGDPEKESLNPDPASRVKYYYVSNLKVEVCPYGVDFRETCMIYREKLACVHEFYDSTVNTASN